MTWFLLLPALEGTESEQAWLLPLRAHYDLFLFDCEHSADVTSIQQTMDMVLAHMHTQTLSHTHALTSKHTHTHTAALPVIPTHPPPPPFPTPLTSSLHISLSPFS